MNFVAPRSKEVIVTTTHEKKESVLSADAKKAKIEAETNDNLAGVEKKVHLTKTEAALEAIESSLQTEGKKNNQKIEKVIIEDVDSPSAHHDFSLAQQILSGSHERAENYKQQSLDEIEEKEGAEKSTEIALSFMQGIIGQSGIDEVIRAIMTQHKDNPDAATQAIHLAISSPTQLSSYCQSHGIMLEKEEADFLAFLNSDCALAKSICLSNQQGDSLYQMVVSQLFSEENISLAIAEHQKGFKPVEWVRGQYDEMKTDWQNGNRQGALSHAAGLGVAALGVGLLAHTAFEWLRGDEESDFVEDEKEKKARKNKKRKKCIKKILIFAAATGGSIALINLFMGKKIFGKELRNKLQSLFGNVGERLQSLVSGLGFGAAAKKVEETIDSLTGNDQSEEENNVDDASVYAPEKKNEERFEQLDDSLKIKFRRIAKETKIFQTKRGNMYALSEINEHVVMGLNGSFESVGAMLDKGGIYEQAYFGNVLSLVEHATDISAWKELLLPSIQSLGSWTGLFSTPTTDQNFKERFLQWMGEAPDGEGHVTKILRQSMVVREYMLDRQEAVHQHLASLDDSQSEEEIEKQSALLFEDKQLISADHPDAFSFLEEKKLLTVDEVDIPESVQDINEEQEEDCQMMQKIIGYAEKKENYNIGWVHEKAKQIHEELDEEIREGVLDLLLATLGAMVDSESFNREEFITNLGLDKEITSLQDSMKIFRTGKSFSLQQLRDFEQHIDDFHNLKKKIQYGSIYMETTKFDDENMGFAHASYCSFKAFGKIVQVGFSRHREGVTDMYKGDYLSGYAATLPGAYALRFFAPNKKIRLFHKVRTWPVSKTMQIIGKTGGNKVAQQIRIPRLLGMRFPGLMKYILDSKNPSRTLNDLLFRGQISMKHAQQIVTAKKRPGDVRFGSLAEYLKKSLSISIKEANAIQRYIGNKNIRKATFPQGIPNGKKIAQLAEIDSVIQNMPGKQYNVWKSYMRYTKNLDGAYDAIAIAGKRESYVHLFKNIDSISPEELGKHITRYGGKQAIDMEEFIKFIITNKGKIKNGKNFFANSLRQRSDIKNINNIDDLNKPLSKIAAVVDSLKNKVTIPKASWTKAKDAFSKLIPEGTARTSANKNIIDAVDIATDATPENASAVLDGLNSGQSPAQIATQNGEEAGKLARALSKSGSFLRTFVRVLGIAGGAFDAYLMIENFQRAGLIKASNSKKASIIEARAASQGLLAVCLFIPGPGWITAGLIGASFAVSAGFDAIEQYNTNFEEMRGKASQELKNHVISLASGIDQQDRGLSDTLGRSLSFLAGSDIDFSGRESVNDAMLWLIVYEELKFTSPEFKSRYLSAMHNGSDKQTILGGPDAVQEKEKHEKTENALFRRAQQRYEAMTESIGKRIIEKEDGQAWGTVIFGFAAVVANTLSSNENDSKERERITYIDIYNDEGFTEAIKQNKGNNYLDQVIAGSRSAVDPSLRPEGFVESDFDKNYLGSPELQNTTIVEGDHRKDFASELIDDEFLEKAGLPTTTMTYMLARVAEDVFHLGLSDYSLNSLGSVFSETNADTYGIYISEKDGQTVLGCNDWGYDEVIAMNSGPDQISSFVSSLQSAIEGGDLIATASDSGENILSKDIGGRLISSMEKTSQLLGDKALIVQKGIIDEAKEIEPIGSWFMPSVENIVIGSATGLDMGKLLYKWDDSAQQVIVYDGGKEETLASVLKGIEGNGMEDLKELGERLERGVGIV